jgi:hypothetical protein
VPVLEIEHRDYRDTLKRCAELGGARLIVTSPPYLDSRARGHYGFDCSAWTETDYDALGEAVLAGLMPGGVCCLNIFGRVARWRGGAFGSERSTTWMKIALRWQESGLRYLECYAYGREGVPGLMGPRHRSGWEPVHVFARPGADPYFTPRGVTRPARQAGTRKYASTHRTSTGTGHTKALLHAPERAATTLVDIGNVSPAGEFFNGDHPAAFDRRLVDFFMLSYSAPGDLVCDPFVGSGTVATSAARHGRSFVGGDLGERLENLDRERSRARWADVARERMLAARGPT